MLASLIDRTVSLLSPRAGLERMHARASLKTIEKLLGGDGGYNAGKMGRLASLKPNLHENAVPGGQLERLTAQSRDLYRNNPHARKIVRQITVKTIGTGMQANPQATRDDGTPHVEFRTRAKKIWQRFTAQSDHRGRPGRGGQNFTGQAALALACTVRTGNVLYRLRPLSHAEQQRRGLMIPLVLQLIDADRLDHALQEHAGNRVFRGVELDADGLPVAYHVLPHHPTDPLGGGITADPQRIPADQAGHLFIAEDVDQVVGATWFAAALEKLRDSGDYEYSELKAAAMGACIVAGIRRPQGAPRVGLAGSATDPLTDDDGNRITRLQPGMFFDLGADGSLEGFNPQRPNTNAADFIGHMLRTIAGAVPGLKGSSLTGDYRRSSFASERSADNEIWPEIEGVQQWFGAAFNQPVFETVIDTAVLSGLFADVIPTAEYFARRDELLATNWQGPVARSINPSVDADAAAKRIANGTSSPQAEAAKLGRNWLDVLQEIEEYVDQVRELDIPEALADQLLSAVLIGDAAPPAIPTEGLEFADTEDDPNTPEPEDEDAGEEDTDDEDDEDARTWSGRLPSLTN